MSQNEISNKIRDLESMLALRFVRKASQAKNNGRGGKLELSK